jgi:hypothetical protein
LSGCKNSLVFLFCRTIVDDNTESSVEDDTMRRFVCREQTSGSTCLEAGRRLILLLLGQQDRVDVGDDTTGGDGDAAQQLVELLVVANGELQVARHDTLALVIARRVASQLEDLGGEVLEHGSQVDWRTGANARGVATLAQVTVHTTDRDYSMVMLSISTGVARNHSTQFKLKA